MSIPADLDRARQLIFAAKEEAAKDLLLSLIPQIEEADRDDLMMEVLAQLGELYLVRTAYDGVREAIRRIDDCLAVYRSVLSGTNPDAAAQVTMSVCCRMPAVPAWPIRVLRSSPPLTRQAFASSRWWARRPCCSR